MAMTRLSDALRAANDERQLSSREIAAIGGDVISYSTVSRYLRGDHPANPDDAALQTFSAALGIPVQKLRELAGQRAGESAPYIPPPEVHRLTATQRRALDGIIRAMANPDGVQATRSNVTRIRPATERSVRRAAAPKAYKDSETRRIRRDQDAAGEENQDEE